MTPNETALRVLVYLRSRKGFDSWWSEVRDADQADIHAALVDYIQEACDAAVERYERQADPQD